MTVWVTGKVRPTDRLHRESPGEPTLASIVAVAEPGAWLGGGEPTLRADLPALVRALEAPGLVTDALPLAQASVRQTLLDAGLAKVRVRLHAARRDAHDWLVGMEGAAKTALRAIRALRGAGVEVELCATLTRPTAPHASELLALARELDLAAVELVRLDTGAVDEAQRVALAPRLGLLEADLARAVQAAHGVELRLVDVPRCAAPRLDRWRHPSAWRFPEGAPGPASGERRRCAGCPGLPACAGVEAAYVERFGEAELAGVGAQVPAGRTREGLPAWVAVEAPGPRGHGTPRAHLAAVGEPLGAAGEVPGEAVVAFEGTTRAIRRHLITVAQRGTSSLRVVSPSLRHPAAMALLRECTRLGLAELHVEGDTAPLGAVEDAIFFPLRGAVTTLTVLLEGPDAAAHDAATGEPGSFAAALDGARRFAAITGATLAVRPIRDPDAFAARWSEPEPLVS